MVGQVIKYLFKRLALLVPTLIAIIGINFLIVQLAPGGPLETVAAKMRQQQTSAHQFAGAGFYQGDEGLDPAMVHKLNKEFGFDKPPLTRFLLMLKGYLTFNLGESFFQAAPVSTLIWQRLPVSVSLGLWSTLLVYLVSIPLGIHKAADAGSGFDKATTAVIIAAYAVPGFLLAVFLVILLRRRLGGAVPAARPGLAGCRRLALVGPRGGLRLAPGPADRGDDRRRLRDADDADQKFVSG